VIDAQALNAGPVSMSPDDTAIEAITVSKCPAAAILVRGAFQAVRRDDRLV